jgi:hypothetical protein
MMIFISPLQQSSGSVTGSLVFAIHKTFPAHNFGACTDISRYAIVKGTSVLGSN